MTDDKSEDLGYYYEPSTVLVESSKYKAGDKLDLYVEFDWGGRPF